jgi:alkanesulfonate monooxygenase SsuD/methylene tetrahydromethanopterin reductase-like flavin-dependent oxidoreductase (luciferase family)
VAARIQEYIDAGARHVIISPAVPEDSLGVVTLAAEEVLPQLELRSGSGGHP